MRGSVGIGIWLKVDDEFFGSITLDGSLHTLLNLFADGGQFSGQFGGERIYIAISTSSITFTAITIGASETAIGNDLKNPLTIVLLAKISAVMPVRLLSII